MIYIINSLLVGWEVQNFIREGKAKTEGIIKKGVAYINLLVTISQRLVNPLCLIYRDKAIGLTLASRGWWGPSA